MKGSRLFSPVSKLLLVVAAIVIVLDRLVCGEAGEEFSFLPLYPNPGPSA